ncbi:GNAT family N-acetyltransferase [Neptunomonas japonica]|uniref:Acetyltransferase n=1 Tax=Neptunomonas japonica JAMM 1380 TaxID=1441457 RepID=A0A7R6PUH8_9GAMM|nr:GNAT family N-acetyltransferase [Neptunomonas japonica]BBB29728.1 acetyltransferase [Neptunomonas japonica JAMM 1380]
MNLIKYSPDKAKDIADLFYASVHAIDSSIYSNEQKDAWASTPINYSEWAKRLERKKPYLLVIKGEVAGFIELESDGHIDCAYVAPKFQRKGVATKLLKHVMSVAKNVGLKQLYVEASIVAKPFFEKAGFLIENENQVIRHNIVLINYSMRMKI